MIETYDLYQFVDFPTRRTTESSSILDLVFSNAEAFVKSITATPGISDHDGVHAKVSCKRPQKTISQPRKVYSFEKGDYSMISHSLDEQYDDFIEASLTFGVEELWELFRTTFLSLIDEDILSKILPGSQRKNKPWFTREIKLSLNKKIHIFKRYVSNRNEEIFKSVEEISCEITKKIKCAKDKFYSSLSEKLKRSPKELWKFVKQSGKEEETTPPFSTIQGFKTDDVYKANHFNKYFQSVFSTPVVSAPSAESSQCHLPSMPDIDVTYNGVLKLLEEL
ncbi:hypothetical protein HPB48_024976 [Haemaphysalis longicornis]|uniref:Uncharacterized protein n=1 Tax=Haemaphysalis longicornis TaxID=44386 RepID=A0A9J6H732_HAELO|nr:hypothetical protein HPB48_024976 [Haemaphysalis longicornis]